MANLKKARELYRAMSRIVESEEPEPTKEYKVYELIKIDESTSKKTVSVFYASKLENGKYTMDATLNETTFTGTLEQLQRKIENMKRG